MVKPALTECRYAVCIGINQYSPPSGLATLRYAEQDAQAMHDMLGQLGFPQENRILLRGEQATLEAINTALADIILDKAEGNDLIVFYFAGHSIPIAVKDVDGDAQRQSEVFLTTYDFDRRKIIDSRAFRLQQALGMERIRRTFFEGEGSRKRLFLFDSCYSGDFSGPRYRDEVNPVQGYIKYMLDSTSAGRVALSSCLPIQKAAEDPVLGHGRFTYYILEALSGRDPKPLRRDGWLTVNGLFEYLAKMLPSEQRPVLTGVQQDEFKLICYPEKAVLEQKSYLEPEHPQVMKKVQLRALLVDHSSFMYDRLQSFVGRKRELREIREYIARLMEKGGYLTITGQAGQGKSSIIAKLVSDSGPDQTAYHFIPFNPGPDHQVGLLRNVMSQLILKYDLSDLYVASETRAALRDFFPKALTELLAKGGQECIFIDGLDQLEEDNNGKRDLTFLPNNPPPGVVFVLGTRPNDALFPLKLLKSHIEYCLPNLCRQDFDLILQHRGVNMERRLADQFYTAMQENAMYLDLVAKELAESGTVTPVEMMKRLADNPDNLFSLSIERLKRQIPLWEKVIYPVLGLLLVAREPLKTRHIGHILELEDYRLRDGLAKLGGLISEDGQHQCSLFHLKLYDYLHQDENRSDKEYLFAKEEEENWHRRLASWCKGENLSIIWQETKNNLIEQARREYARKHYATHLYFAEERQTLFSVLNTDEYGLGKIRFDPSMRLYAQDLDFGRQAATKYEDMLDDGLALLTYLWRYTLLRCSLTSRADRYTPRAFETLILLKREREAFGLVELLTDPSYKVEILVLIAHLIGRQPERAQEFLPLLMRAYEVTKSIENIHIRAKTQVKLGITLIDAKQEERAEEVWNEARKLISTLESARSKSRALLELAIAFNKAQQNNRAEEVWNEAVAAALNIQSNRARLDALKEVILALVDVKQWEFAESMLQQIKDLELQSFLQEMILQRRIGTRAVEEEKQMGDTPEQCIAFLQKGQWKPANKVIEAIENWTRPQIQQVLDAILGRLYLDRSNEKVLPAYFVLSDDQENYQQTLSMHINAIMNFNVEDKQQAAYSYTNEYHESIYYQQDVLQRIGIAMVNAQMWEQTETLISAIGNQDIQAGILLNLVVALANAQLWQEVQRIFTKIINVIRSITDNEEKLKVFANISTAFAKLGQWEHLDNLWIEMKDIIGTTIGSYDIEIMVDVLLSLSRALGQKGQLETVIEIWTKAQKMICANGYVEGKERAQINLVKEMIQQKQWKNAKEAIDEFDEQETRTEMLFLLGNSLSEDNKREDAEAIWAEVPKLMYMIEDSEARAYSMLNLGNAFIRAQMYEYAERVWPEVETNVATIKDTRNRINVLQQLGMALFHASQIEKAEKTWAEVQEIIHTINHAERQAETFIELGIYLVQANQEEWANTIWNEVEKIVDEVDSNKAKARMLQKLAIALIQIGQESRANTIWAKIEKVASMIEGSLASIKIMQDLSVALIQRQQEQRAGTILSKVEQLISELSDSDAKAEAMLNLSSMLSRLQQWEWAETLLHTIDQDWAKIRALQQLAVALAQEKQWERAMVVWIEGEELWSKASQTADGNKQRIDAMLELSKAYTLDQQYTRAEEIWHEVEEMTDNAEILQEFGVTLAQCKQWEWAEKVIHGIGENRVRTVILQELGTSLAEDRQYVRAENVAYMIEDNRVQAKVFRTIANHLAIDQELELLLQLVQRAWLRADTRADALNLLPLSTQLIPLKPEIGITFCEAFAWTDIFLKG